MNVLVTGANGQLGQELRRLVAEEASPHHFIYTGSRELDITQPDAIRKWIEKNGIQAIVNCAAYTNVEQAEDDEAAAELVNSTAVGYLAAAARNSGALLIHISTDYVFGGTGNVPLTEDFPVSPLGAYGRTKLKGELAIAAEGCRHVILRTSWLYSSFGKNFAKTMLKPMATRDEVSVVYDQIGTPTHAGDLAKAIHSILSDPVVDSKLGVYHYSNEGACSWYDFAMAIAELSGSTCSVRPCLSHEFPTKAARPAYSVLDKAKVKQAFGLSIPHWRSSLAAHFHQFSQEC